MFFKKRFRYNNGWYEGGYFADAPHGKGKLVYDNGNVYEGEWKYGMMCGHGTM